MPTIVNAADAAQLLALIPRLVGYTPTDSLVLVPLSGRRSLGAMRLDLPPEDDLVAGRVHGERIASTALGMVCRVEDADAVIAVMYTDAGTPASLPYARFAEALAECAETCGLDLVDVLTIGANGWGSHLDPRRRGEVRPLEEIAVAPGDGDQSSGARLPDRSPQEQAGVAAALASLRTSLEVLCGIPSGAAHADRVDPAALEAACELDDLPRLFEKSLAWDAAHLTAMQAATIVWCLSRPSLRDVALVQWASDLAGGDRALDAQRRWEDGEEYPADLAEIMWGDAEAPDAARLTAAFELVRQAAGLAPREHRAGPLATCAWLSWALGGSTHADRYATLAQDIESQHGLADIVRSFVAAGHLPDWAFRGRGRARRHGHAAATARAERLAGRPTTRPAP